MEGSITCSKLIINGLAGSPTRSENVYFANNEQASIVVFTAVFCFTHAEHHLIKLKLTAVFCFTHAEHHLIKLKLYKIDQRKL